MFSESTQSKHAHWPSVIYQGGKFYKTEIQYDDVRCILEKTDAILFYKAILSSV